MLLRYKSCSREDSNDESDRAGSSSFVNGNDVVCDGDEVTGRYEGMVLGEVDGFGCLLRD